jgi:hypothetical protein
MNRLHTTTRLWTFFTGAMLALVPAGRLLVSLVAATVTAGVWLATPAWADPFSFSTGNPDGLLGALSQPASTGHLETETADDFILSETTSIAQATIIGLIPSGTPLADISNVEVEIYHVFPKDSVDPPSGNVPARANSPADVEIDTATRDGSLGTLAFSASLLGESFSVLNTVVDGINPKPGNMTNGEGPDSGEEVKITITFNPAIVLPADHYFFRPEVLVTGGDFLYLSAPKPIVAPGTPFIGDLQAWIRNSNLKPDWLRIGTDIIGGTPVQTYGNPAGNGNLYTAAEQQRWRRLRYRRRPVGKPPNPLPPAGAGRGVVVDAPAARVRTPCTLASSVCCTCFIRP